MSDDIITSAEAAIELGISVRIIQRLCQSGRLRATPHGRMYLIRRGDLDAVRDRPQGWPRGRPRKPAAE